MNDAIVLNRPYVSKKALTFMDDFAHQPEILQQKKYSDKCLNLIKRQLKCTNGYLTKSCTQALETAALLLNIQKGDEIILPSFAYVATASAFVQRGAYCKFVDINPNTLNIDAGKIEAAITPQTKAIVTINYAGIACEYDKILSIADEYKIAVVEDNAMGYGAKFKEKELGSFGDISMISFDYAKNVSCGEGGFVRLNNEAFLQPFEVIAENGTDKTAFLRGETGFFEWKGLGTNVYLSEILAAFLYPQLQDVLFITSERIKRWQAYQTAFDGLEKAGRLQLMHVPEDCKHNGHNYVIFLPAIEVREKLSSFLSAKGISSAFHYLPLHSSQFGKQAGVFSGTDLHTTKCANTLLRLPLYPDLSSSQQEIVINAVYDFFKN